MLPVDMLTGSERVYKAPALDKEPLATKGFWELRDAGSEVVVFPREVRGNQLSNNQMVSLKT